MPILITCPTCGTNAAAPDNAAGKKVKCPKCQAVLDVPAQEAPPVLEVEPQPVVQYAPPPSAYPAPAAEPPSSRRGREDDYDDEPRRRRRDEDEDEPRRRRGRFSCPFCGSTAPPYEREEINSGGWVLFVVLILFCIPLCWIPLITMKDKIRHCSSCGTKIG